MAGAASSHGARQAGRYLGELLSGRFKGRWEPYVQRQRASEINLSAVATVLASYLWEHPEREGDVDIDPSKLVDTVWRAVRGKSLTRERLELFIAAFRINDEAETLRQLWTGTQPTRVIIGDLAPPDGHSVTPSAYQTIQLHELHYLGPDGQPARHRTLQTIRALTDGLSTHRYSFDTLEGIVGQPPTTYRLYDRVHPVYPRARVRRLPH